LFNFTKERRKLKISIVGLLPAQFNHIQQDFGKDFILKNYYGDDKGIAKHVTNSDIVIGITNFMNHSTEDTIKNLNNIQYIRHKFGISKLKTLLSGIKDEQTSLN
jgi:hypothetical protein